LASLEARLDLVDHIDPALAPDELIGAMAAAQRFQGVADFHNNPVGSKFGRVIKDTGPPVKHWKLIAKAPFPGAWPAIDSRVGLL
jgi:hypothetical protein